MKTVFYSVVMAMLLACMKQKQETQTFLVADHKVDCTGAGPQQCLLIKQQEAEDWQYFYDTIEGFDYEEGFEYTIKVAVYEVPNPLADASGKRYVLKQIIRKK